MGDLPCRILSAQDVCLHACRSLQAWCKDRHARHGIAHAPAQSLECKNHAAGRGNKYSHIVSPTSFWKLPQIHSGQPYNIDRLPSGSRTTSLHACSPEYMHVGDIMTSLRCAENCNCNCRQGICSSYQTRKTSPTERLPQQQYLAHWDKTRLTSSGEATAYLLHRTCDQKTVVAMMVQWWALMSVIGAVPQDLCKSLVPITCSGLITSATTSSRLWVRPGSRQYTAKKCGKCDIYVSPTRIHMFCRHVRRTSDAAALAKNPCM